MTLEISLAPEVIAKLRERAAAEGKDMESFVREAVEKVLSSPDETAHENEQLSAERWSAEWHAWADSHPKVDHFVDDSRESIYAGRGE